MQKMFEMGAISSIIGDSVPSVLVPQVMSYPSTVTCSICPPTAPLCRRVGSTWLLRGGGETHALLNRIWSPGSFLVEARIRCYPRGEVL